MIGLSQLQPYEDRDFLHIGCTACRYDIHLLQMRYNEFVEKDAQVFVVVQSTPENVREDLKEINLPFDVI